MPKRIYYAVKPAKVTYKEPRTAYLSVRATPFGEFLNAAAINEEGELYDLGTPGEVIGFLNSLKSSTWVITYNASYISSLIPEAIKVFDLIDGYGTTSYVLTFWNGDSKVYLIDIFSFTLKPLEAKDDYISQLIAIANLWKEYRGLIQSTFGVHPSKAPGSTALKTWKTTITNSYTTKGKRIGKHAREACTFGALHWNKGHYKEAWYYDMNASYLGIMRHLRYPTRMTGFIDNPPPTKKWIALVNISYKTALHFSPLTVQVREQDKETIMHPNEAENMRARLTYIDYLLLRQHGELTINEWIEGVAWNDDEEENVFTTWVDTMETALDQNKLLKVTSRSLHSKFAQGDMPTIEIKHMSNAELKRTRKTVLDIYPFDGGQAVKVEVHKRPRFKPYYQPSWEALTLAAARLVLYDVINADTVYMDTDSIISLSERPDLDLGEKFGQWRLQEHGPAWIAGPRYYVIGDRAKASGVRASITADIKPAIIDAIVGRSAAVTAIRNPSLRNSHIKQAFYKHRFRAIQYPFVRVFGRHAFVTRSPTVKRETRYHKRLIS